MSAVALRPQPAYADDSQCPKPKHVIHRSNEEVLADHYAALLSGDPQRVACDYADDASVILAGTVATGREEIAGLFAYFFSLMGGPGSIAVHSVTTTGTVLLLEWGLESPHLTVADGVDTFVFRKGRISYQTIHLGAATSH